MSAAQLYESYVLYGEDPFIQSVDVPQVPFSARDYAQERCQALCAGQSPPQAPPAADPSAGGAN